ncbi:hypothetical protein CEXT_158361 [Caerostris extrusa]|uniref:Uncharacterized protein n=1 Tax=Caerostris extrusa TaxID=172846 RepID=A0AAV4XFM4_CAEEX|nr:hypothetical protein CEXT_158361 [Caerostris extrusa]
MCNLPAQEHTEQQSKSWQINNPTSNESVPMPEMSTINIRPEYSSDGIKRVGRQTFFSRDTTFGGKYFRTSKKR